MKLAFSLFNYFPYGGLERNFMRITKECLNRGHSVDVFAISWEGEKPQGANIVFLPVNGLSNHSQAASFSYSFSSNTKGKNYDLIMGFNKMPNLDLYYSADVCYVHRIGKERSFLSRMTPRYRQLATLENSVFSRESGTEVIILSDIEKKHYQKIYGTPDTRFHSVPPGVDKSFIRSSISNDKRDRIRQELGFDKHDTFLLMVGSHFHTKGVDRSIQAVSSLPSALKKTTHLYVIGKGNRKKYESLAEKLNISSNIHFLGTKSDVPRFLAGADLVLQPSRTDNTGNTIVEALVAGIPVLATDSCGYAFHIANSQAGKIIPCSPFNQKVMNSLLVDMVQSTERDEWRKRALNYSDNTDLYNRFQVILDLIEAVGFNNDLSTRDRL